MITKFKSVHVEHMQQEYNIRADLLFRLFTNKNKIHQSIDPIKKFLDHGTCEVNEEKMKRQCCTRYFIIGQDFFEEDMLDLYLNVFQQTKSNTF